MMGSTLPIFSKPVNQTAKCRLKEYVRGVIDIPDPKCSNCRVQTQGLPWFLERIMRDDRDAIASPAENQPLFD